MEYLVVILMSSAEAKGLILGYRRGTNTQYPNEVLLKLYGVDDRGHASQFIGKKVVYVDEKGNTYRGKIIGVHGRKGVVRAVFNPNLPGQAIGKEVKVIKE